MKSNRSERGAAQVAAIELRAFAAGKDAGERASDPWPPAEWLRGWTHAASIVNGQRPLDTARRVS